MEEYGIFRADSNQMWAVDGKQEIYLEWPKIELKAKELRTQPPFIFISVCNEYTSSLFTFWNHVFFKILSLLS